MAETIATLQAIIGADITGLRRGMQEARGEVNSFSDRLFAAGGHIQEFGMRLTGLTDPIRRAFGTGVQVASNFQDIMAEIGARAGLTADQMDAVSQAALQLGTDTVFSAQQAAEGYLQLMTAGMSVEEAMATLPAVLDAAAASGESVSRAADGITNIMSGFRTEVLDAAQVADALARAAGASPASMGEMMDAIAAVGPIADQMGLSFDDTVGVMTEWANAGLRGAEAGTMLRRMLMQMTDGTETTAAAWDRLGTSFYTAEGALRPFPDIISDMQAGMGALASSAERNEVVRDLAGTYSALGLSLLLGGEGLAEVSDQLSQQADVGTVAAARMGTFSGASDSLQGSIEALMTTTLTPFMENTLTPLVGKVQEIVDATTEWARQNPEVANTIITIVGAIAVIGIPLTLFGVGLKVLAGIVAVGGTLVGGLAAVAAGIWAIMSPALVALAPVALLAAAVAGFVAAVTSFGPDIVATWTENFRLLGVILDDFIRRVNEALGLHERWNQVRTGHDAGFATVEPLMQEQTRRAIEATGLGQFNPFGRAAGGPVSAGLPYLVGERGAPEIFVPRTSGHITPLPARLPEMGGGGRQVTINLTANGVSDPFRLVDIIAREVRRRTF